MERKNWLITRGRERNFFSRDKPVFLYSLQKCAAELTCTHRINSLPVSNERVVCEIQ